MTTILLVIHLMISLALVGLILIQRSEGGLGGIGGGGGGGGGGAGFGGLMSARGSANFLTRTTAVLALAFMTMSLLLAILASGDRTPRSILDAPTVPTQQVPAQQVPTQPAAPLVDQ